ncbi:24151_t:CDS:2, partial [Racocetra persica]
TIVDTSVPVVDEWVTSSDGVEIYTRTWKAVSDKPIATVVFLHGFGDMLNVTTINKNSTRLVAQTDITEALISRRREGIPQFLMGHSMGGCLILNYVLDGPEKHNIAGLLCVSPLIQLTPNAKQVISLYVLHVASKLLPNVKLNTVNANCLSRDPIEIKKYKEDPLVCCVASLRNINDMISDGKSLMKKKYIDINIPIYIAHGTEDMITDPNASKLLIEKTTSKDKTFHAWDGRYHELHNDYDNTEVIKSYIQWILKHAKSESRE